MRTLHPDHRGHLDGGFKGLMPCCFPGNKTAQTSAYLPPHPPVTGSANSQKVAHRVLGEGG